MPYSAASRLCISRRSLLKGGVSSLACHAMSHAVTAYAQKMTPMVKRNPTAAERDAVLRASAALPPR